MNYYVELFYYCIRNVFNFFDKPYCTKWDKLLLEILNGYDLVDTDNKFPQRVYTLDFMYKGRKYSVWVSNGFYGAGSLFQLGSKYIHENDRKRPSFNTTYRLLKLKDDLINKDKAAAKTAFEKDLYGE